MIAEISSDEEEGFLEETPSATSISILEPAPITLKKSRTSEFTNDVDNQPSHRSSGQNQEDFTEEMNKKVQSILTEAVFYSNDPREYHPFYLEVEKVISSCQSLGYIGQNEEHIQTIWKEFDDLARRMNESGTAELRMPSELSPYALFIRSGKAFNTRKVIGLNGKDKDCNFQELKEKAKKIFKVWKSKNGNQRKFIRDDLDARLKFFEECKTVTLPSDVVKMNNIWREFLNEFTDQNNRSVPCQRILGNESAKSSPLNDIEVIEPPTSPEVIKIESEEDEALETPELRLSSFDQETRASKALVNARRINVAVETVPSKYQVRVLVEDIAKSHEWGRNLRLLLRKRHSSSSPSIDMNTNTRRSKRVKREVIREDFVSFGKIGARSKRKFEARGCDTARISKATQNQKTRRVLRKRPDKKMKGVANQKLLNSRKSGLRSRSETKKHNYRKLKCKRESEKVRNFRLKKFRKDWKRKRLELIAICRRRRRWEQERRKRSEKVDVTLEYMITGQCKLRTLKNRVKWFWKPMMKRNRTPPHIPAKSSKNTRGKRQGRQSTRNTTKKRCGKGQPMGKMKQDERKTTVRPRTYDFKCPFCQFECSNSIRRLRHIRTVHPTKVEEFRLSMRKRYKELRREQRRLLQETGEGPDWLKAEKVNRRLRYQKRKIRGSAQETICDECGGLFLDLDKHKATVHKNSKQIASNTCPICGELTSDGTVLWHHFLSKHLNYDYVALSKLKGELMGFKYKDSVLFEEDDNDINNDVSISHPSGSRGRGRQRGDGDVRISLVGPSAFQCTICGKQFESVYSAERHLKTVHDENQTWNCPQCPKTFKVKTSVDSHVKQFHKGIDHRCDVCQKKMQTLGKLWKHKVDIHGMRDLEPPEGLTLIECDYCGEKFMRGMLAHIREKHPEKEVEHLERTKMEAKGRIKERVRYRNRKLTPLTPEAHKKRLERRRAQRKKWREEGVTTAKWLMSETPKICPHCGVKTAQFGSWPDHLKDEHNIIVNSRKFMCPVEGCGKSYNRGFKLMHHSMEHFTLYENLTRKKYVEETKTPRKLYHCLLCREKEEMLSRGQVMIHFALCHKEEYEKFKGPLEPHSRELQLQDHLNQASVSMTASSFSVSEKFPCSHCVMELMSHSVLKEHVISFHPEECLECPFPDCEQMMISPEEMEEHFSEQHNQLDQ